MSKYTAVVIGATGLIGHSLLELLLEHEKIEGVSVLTRRTVGIEHPKLEEQIVDFQNREELRLKMGKGDLFFCCIGTTQKKVRGDKEEYKKIDFGIPVTTAEIAFDKGFSTYLFVSSVGADSKSKNFYLQLKGKAEDVITSIGFKNTAIFRPSILLGKRDEYRAGENAAKALMRFSSGLFVGRYKKYRAIEASEVAKAMVLVGTGNGKGVHIYEYQKMMKVIKENQV